MAGDERTRFCDLCKLNVHNIAALTASEVEELVIETQGRLCGKIYQRADGTILTKDCPVGLRTHRRRVAGFAGAVFAAVLGAVGLTYAQKEEPTTVDAVKAGVVKTADTDTGSGRLAGVVSDPMGAVIPAAKIEVYRAGKKLPVAEALSDSEGRFSFDRLPEGVYEIRLSGVSGFKKHIIQNVEIKADRETSTEAMLTPSDVTEILIGVIAEPGLIEMTPERKTVLDREMLDRMPRRRVPFDD